MLLNGSERVTVPNSNKNSRKSKKWFYNNEVCVMGVMNFFGFRGPIDFCPRNKKGEQFKFAVKETKQRTTKWLRE